MSEKKKVLEFVGQLGDGGAETLVVSYAKMLDRTTFDVAVLTIYNDNNTANSKRLIENNILVLSVFNKHNYITKIIWHVMGRKYMTFTLIVGCGMRRIIEMCTYEGILKLIISIIICATVPNIIYFLIFGRTTECNQILYLIRKRVRFL